MSDQTSEEAVQIFEEMKKLFHGHQTAAVYMSIGLVLGHMEAHAKQPDRPNLLRIISDVMDDFAAHTRLN